MASSSHAPAAQNGSASSYHTPTALSRWSILDRQLPAPDKIAHLHVYDFDNTLFKTPLPNAKIWNGFTIGTLASPDIFINGGWWHDSRILAATGEGLAKEEPRAWEGWWNEKVVELVRLSIQQKDALCVLLTGRSESGFSELVRRMVASKGLEFDLISLKPAVGPNSQRFASTMIFKQAFLRALMETYRGAEEIRIYEDRVKHVKAFRDFMADYTASQRLAAEPRVRGPLRAEVVQVADLATNLDPVVEVAEVQHLVNAHNEALVKRSRSLRGEKLIIKKTVFYTGYLIKPADTQRLLNLAQLPPGNLADTDLKVHANNIMICPRPCPHSILEKVGGMGSKMKWTVTGMGRFDDNIWAACLRPFPPTAKYHTDNPVPLVVLALRRGARPVDAGKIQHWQPIPPEHALVFETTVGEKVLLRIEAEDPGESEYESLFPNKAAKLRHTENDGPGFRQHQQHQQQGHQQQQQHHHQGGSYGQTRNFHQSGYMGRGGPNQGRGGSRSGGTPNRGYRNVSRGGGGGGGARGSRGGKNKFHHYHSLDDVGSRNNSQGAHGQQQQVAYDDSAYSQPPPQQPKRPGFQYQPPAPQQQQQQQQQQYGAGGGGGGGGGGGPGPGPGGAGGWQRPPPTAPQRMTSGGSGYGAIAPDVQKHY